MTLGTSLKWTFYVHVHNTKDYILSVFHELIFCTWTYKQLSLYYVNPVYWISWLSLKQKISFPKQNVLLNLIKDKMWTLIPDVPDLGWVNLPSMSTTSPEGFKKCVHVHKSNTSLNLKNHIVFILPHYFLLCFRNYYSGHWRLLPSKKHKYGS